MLVGRPTLASEPSLALAVRECLARDRGMRNPLRELLPSRAGADSVAREAAAAKLEASVAAAAAAGDARLPRPQQLSFIAMRERYTSAENHHAAADATNAERDDGMYARGNIRKCTSNCSLATLFTTSPRLLPLGTPLSGKVPFLDSLSDLDCSPLELPPAAHQAAALSQNAPPQAAPHFAHASSQRSTAGLHLLSSAATLIERVQEEACVQPTPKRFRRSDGEGGY